MATETQRLMNRLGHYILLAIGWLMSLVIDGDDLARHSFI